MTTLVQGALLDAAPTKPTYSELMICADCGWNLGHFSPHHGGPEGQKYAVLRAHRATAGCPAGHPACMVVFCSLCPGIVVATRTLSMKGGDWWGAIGHPHDQLHDVMRERTRLRRAPAEPFVPSALPYDVTRDGEVTSPCRSCGSAMVWRLTSAGKWCPMDVVKDKATARPHMATCPEGRRRKP